MSEDISGRQWVEKLGEQADEAFQDHQVQVIGPGHWLIRRPTDGPFWTHIVTMGSGLAVWGDIDACVFAYSSGEPEQLVAWMADASYSYGREKAQIGTGCGVDHFEPSVAIYDLRQKLADAPECYGETWPEIEADYTDAIEEAISLTEAGEPFVVMQANLVDNLERIDQDAWEWVLGIGMVPSPRVIYALAAVRCLHRLLQAGS